jgi:NADH-quinone oxidoreductase subunit K
MSVPLPFTLLLAVIGLFGIGLYGLLAARNLIKIIIALQIATKAAVLALVGAGMYAGQLSLGQEMALMVIFIDTLVAVTSLALAVKVHSRFGTLDLKVISSLKG